VLDTSSQTKITDLKVTITIEKQITWFKIPMKYVGRVDVFETLEHLIRKILYVIIAQRIFGIYHFMQIRFHKSQYHVQILEIGANRRGNEVNQAHNIFVMKVPEKLDFSQNTLCINYIFESLRNLFDGYFFYQ